MNSEHPASIALLAFFDSELSHNRALGDYQTMLRALWNKRDNPTLIQNPTKLPIGYRSLAVWEYVRFGRCELTTKWRLISRPIQATTGTATASPLHQSSH